MSARQSPSGVEESTKPRHSRSLARRLILALTAMLLPVVAVAGAGVLIFGLESRHSKISAMKRSASPNPSKASRNCLSGLTTWARTTSRRMTAR